jgi:DNA-directed RNA polymerase subunit F
MADLEIIEETPVTMAQLRDQLGKIKERDGELNFRSNKTEEFLNSYVTLDAKATEELKQKLEGLNIPRLKEEHIVKLIDLLPVTPEEVKSILQGYTITVTKDNLGKLASAIKEVVPEK